MSDQAGGPRRPPAAPPTLSARLDAEVVVARSGPPAYAWDWFARQRLLWREARSRLSAASSPVAARYAGLSAKADVVSALRSDYGRDDVVRDIVHAVVAELVFLGRTDAPFARLGAVSAPRGMRWWWTALTGEELDRPARTETGATQLRLDDAPAAERGLDDVLGGYGDP